jgi:hypothetical protein
VSLAGFWVRLRIWPRNARWPARRRRARIQQNSDLADILRLRLRGRQRQAFGQQLTGQLRVHQKRATMVANFRNSNSRYRIIEWLELNAHRYFTVDVGQQPWELIPSPCQALSGPLFPVRYDGSPDCRYGADYRGSF